MASTSPAQHRLMEAAAHDPKVAKRTGVPQDVAREYAAADEGKHFAEGGAVPQLIPAINPQGQLVQIEPGQWADAVSQGYRQPTPAEWQSHFEQTTYGGTKGQIEAGVLGAAQVLPVIGEPIAATAMGLTPEEALKLREENPLTHGAAAVAGTILPTVASGGTSLASKAAGATTGGIINKAGEKVGEAVAEKVGTGLAGRLAPGVARAATETALFQANDVASRAVLGDPALTAEKAAAEIGIAGVLGAGGGAAFGLGAEGLGAVLGRGAKAADRAADALGEFASERNIKAAGAIQSDINRALKTKSPDQLQAIGKEFADRGLVGPTTTPGQTLERAQALVATGREEAASLTAAADATEGAPRWSWNEIRQKLEPDLMESLKGKASTRTAADALGKELDKISETYGDRPLGLADLHALRKDVDALAGYGVKNMDPAVRPVAGPLKAIRRFLDQNIEDGLETANGSGAAWREAMRKQEVGITAENFARAGMKRAHGNNMVSPTELLGGLTGILHGGTLEGLTLGAGTALVRRHASGVLGWVAGGAEKALRGLMAGTDRAIAERAAGIFTEAAASATAQAVPRVTAKAFDRIADEIRDLNSNPERLAENVGGHTTVIADHSPDHAQAFSAFAGNAVSYLASKLPDTSPQGPLDSKRVPSADEVARFGRVYSVAQQPISVLDHVAQGTLTPEHVEALAAIYPKLTEEMRQQALSELAKAMAKGNRPAYRTRLSLAMFLGEPLNFSMSPQSMQANQAAFMSPSPQQPKPSPQSLSLGDRMQTPMQQSGARAV